MANHTGAFLTGMVVGGVAGVTVALLTAPQSGEETRAQITEKTNEIADQAKNKLNDIQTQTVETVNDVKQRAQTQAKATVDDLAQRTSNMLRSASKQVELLEKEIAGS